LSNKIDDTKSTALSTHLTVSEDFKSLIRKELAQFKEEALTARSELSQLKLDMSQMIKDIIRQELPSIVAEIQQQSAGVYLIASEYKADMIAFQPSFQTTLKAQTNMIQQLSS
jgi:curli biogenesis system outer membrane secretion channel CsgG